MSIIQRVVKPTTRKGKIVLLSREPQVIEGPKVTLLFNGRKTSEKVRNTLKDLYDLKKPNARYLSRKNDITIFEDVTPVETICRRHEASLFVIGSHSKKRPNNLVMGRMFNYSLLDMFELGIDAYEGLKEFLGSKVILGVKPCLIFLGPLWEQSEELKQLRSIFVDFFHREHVDAIRLQGLEHALSFTATAEGKILFRSYKVLLKKSGCRTPRIELEEMGPRIDFTLRRCKLAAEDLMLHACRKPKVLKVTKKKNISRDDLGTTYGRIHVGKQNIDRIQTRKVKGLRKTKTERQLEKSKKRLSTEDVELDSKKRHKMG